jgi:hypothetical protein
MRDTPFCARRMCVRACVRGIVCMYAYGKIFECKRRLSVDRLAECLKLLTSPERSGPFAGRGAAHQICQASQFADHKPGFLFERLAKAFRQIPAHSSQSMRTRHSTTEREGKLRCVRVGTDLHIFVFLNVTIRHWGSNPGVRTEALLRSCQRCKCPMPSC